MWLVQWRRRRDHITGRSGELFVESPDGEHLVDQKAAPVAGRAHHSAAAATGTVIGSSPPERLPEPHGCACGRLRAHRDALSRVNPPLSFDGRDTLGADFGPGQLEVLLSRGLPARVAVGRDPLVRHSSCRSSRTCSQPNTLQGWRAPRRQRRSIQRTLSRSALINSRPTRAQSCRNPDSFVGARNCRSRTRRAPRAPWCSRSSQPEAPSVSSAAKPGRTTVAT